MIKVRDKHGKLINSFGKYLNTPSNIPKGASWCSIQIYDNKLYVLFRYFPELRVYNLDGKLISSNSLDKNYNKYVTRHYLEETYSNPYKPSIYFLFRGLEIVDDRIFIGLSEVYLSQKKLIIDEYDLSMNKVKSYRYDGFSQHFTWYDFAVDVSRNKLSFFVSYTDNESNIGEFNVKE